MYTASNGLTIDFRRRPWKGIIDEIAKSEGVSRSAISQAVRKRNPRILTIVAEKVNLRAEEEVVRQSIVDDAEDSIATAITTVAARRAS